MTAGQINRELDLLAKVSSSQTDALIQAGRGFDNYTIHREKALQGDLMAKAVLAVSSREQDLHAEIRARYGPNAPSRLPARGFGPRKK